MALTKKAVKKSAARTTAQKKSASKRAGVAAQMAGESTSYEAREFEAALERAPGYLGWTIARVPFDVHKAFSTMLRLRVKGTIRSRHAKGEGTAFRTSLFPVRSLSERETPDGAGAFFLLVNKAMQRGAGVSAGDMAHFVLEADLGERPAELPDALAALLDEEPGLRAFYDELSESWRREIGKWIHGVKSEEAQLGRCEQMAERLLNTMEAEVELPPLIDKAFRLRPKARAGWAKMTPTQRRQGLLAVFYYRTPEAQQRRLDKLCGEAEERA
ncbi:Bacteriocin-protection, YdeI or OmpD-Associated [Bryocella elongata]|uniref:Bacteriocin-protection, YdeI or OmpD-Associated n=1 Tax=Bryocella elongata TaxID=863522 RepID=A0A1H5WX78_9BACT|nr:YdeI/OmpD-associated family protein [Bryocella elongata]SEG03913.1 Bacteriocin-protection, YdeI or OmpD-Associated [Bryocella elongata]